MSLTVPEGTASVQGDPAGGDCISNCAKWITSLFCCSVDVNEGQTMDTWESFLCSNSCLISHHLRILAVHEIFIHSQLEGFNKALVKGEQETVTASELCTPGLLQSNSMSSKAKASDIMESSSWDPTISSTRESAESRACSLSDAEVAVSQSLNAVLKAASAAVKKRMKCASASPASSDFNSHLRSLESSSVHTNNSSNGARSVDTDDLADNRRMLQPSCNTIASESTKFMEFGAASANAHKHFLTLFSHWNSQLLHSQSQSNLFTTFGIDQPAQSLTWDLHHMQSSTWPPLQLHIRSEESRDLADTTD